MPDFVVNSSGQVIPVPSAYNYTQKVQKQINNHKISFKNKV